MLPRLRYSLCAKGFSDVPRVKYSKRTQRVMSRAVEQEGANVAKLAPKSGLVREEGIGSDWKRRPNS